MISIIKSFFCFLLLSCVAGFLFLVVFSICMRAMPSICPTLADIVASSLKPCSYFCDLLLDLMGEYNVFFPYLVLMIVLSLLCGTPLVLGWKIVLHPNFSYDTFFPCDLLTLTRFPISAILPHSRQVLER